LDTLKVNFRNGMKEVLTKTFWQGVKKTFYEALEEPPPKDGAPQLPAEGNQNTSSTAEAAPQQSSSET
jgi:hypothetical protein